MANVLTSWKEIAQYLGKGVRTVQRWEAEYGLPVRRATSSSHHAVLAVPEEIDAWVQQQTKDRRSELDRLRGEVDTLREENAILRFHLAAAVAGAQQGAPGQRESDSAINFDLLWQASRRSYVSSETATLGTELSAHDGADGARSGN